MDLFFFLSELRKRFIETLNIKDEDVIFPDNSQIFVAQGAAFAAQENKTSYILEELATKFENLTKKGNDETSRLDSLFKDKIEYDEFINRHANEKIDTVDINEYEGDAFLGIDAGSTTIKLVLISDDNKILYSFYSHNKGNPLDNIIENLKTLYKKMGDKIKIKGSCVTGYGENLIKAALQVDNGIVETIAHYKGALFSNQK